MEIKEVVKEKYGQAALRVRSGGSSCCGAGEALLDGSCDPITSNLYDAAQTGTLDVAIDIASVEFGNDKLNEEAVSSTAPPIFEAQKYPTAYYKGTLGGFINGSPTTVAGLLTLHGITQPVALRIASFKCVVDLPATQKHVCGADASGTFNRADFGITIGQRYGFKMEVTLHIQVEATKVE